MAFPKTTVTTGPQAQSLMANAFAAAGAAEPTGGLNYQDYIAWAVAELLQAGGAGTSQTVANAITAFATGGQTSATALTQVENRITVCVTALDSVKLPVSTAGGICTVINDGAAAANIYPVTGEVINGLAANTPVGLANGSRTTFICVVAGTWSEVGRPVPPGTKFVTSAAAVGTLPAGDITGAGIVAWTTTAATPGTQTTRTATLMFTDNPNARVGDAYLLILTNTSGNTLTLAAGSGVTLTGTATVATNVIRFYTVTYVSAVALTIQNIGAGSYS